MSQRFMSFLWLSPTVLWDSRLWDPWQCTLSTECGLWVSISVPPGWCLTFVAVPSPCCTCVLWPTTGTLPWCILCSTRAAEQVRTLSSESPWPGCWVRWLGFRALSSSDTTWTRTTLIPWTVSSLTTSGSFSSSPLPFITPRSSSCVSSTSLVCTSCGCGTRRRLPWVWDKGPSSFQETHRSPTRRQGSTQLRFWTSTPWTVRKAI